MTMTNSSDERRLRKLFQQVAPDMTPLRAEQLTLGSNPRTPHRALAIVASVGLVAAVVVGLLAFGSGSRAQRSGTPGKPLPAATTTPITDSTELDGLAKKAPCNLIQAGGAGLANQKAVSAFGAIAAVNCVTAIRAFPGDGQWQVTIRQVLPGDQLNKLIAVLTRPNQTRSLGTACAGVGYGPLPTLLVDREGHYLHPRMPEDECGGPLPGFFQTLDDLPWRTVSVAKVKQVESEAAKVSGCSMGWKDLFNFGPATRHTDPGSPVFARWPDTLLKTCIYRTGSDPETGEFQRAVHLTTQQSDQLRLALSGPGTSAGTQCSPQKEFAVIQAKGAYVEVELGGCWRVLREDNNPGTLGHADPTTTKTLLKVE